MLPLIHVTEGQAEAREWKRAQSDVESEEIFFLLKKKQLSDE
jgi:hypothetical protein